MSGHRPPRWVGSLIEWALPRGLSGQGAPGDLGLGEQTLDTLHGLLDPLVVAKIEGGRFRRAGQGHDPARALSSYGSGADHVDAQSAREGPFGVQRRQQADEPTSSVPAGAGTDVGARQSRALVAYVRVLHRES